MSSKNILYIGDPNSIHDFKWITYFSNRPEYNTILIAEKNTYSGLKASKKKELEDQKILVLEPIDDFSISNPIQSIRSILRLRKIIKSHQVDTVHVLFGSPQPIWLNFISKKTKTIITTRGSDVLVLINHLKKTPGLLNKVLFFLIKRAFINANEITSTSQKQIDYIISEIVDRKINLIKTGVNVDDIKTHKAPIDIDLPAKKKVILSIRYIAEIYNLNYQIDAIKRLNSDILKSSIFIFIKSQNCKEVTLINFVSQLKKIEHLEYKIIDNLNQSQIWSLIKESSLVYMVPLSDGTPNSALETMAASTPLIMGNLDYNKELFQDVCLVADLKNPKSLADNIILGLENYPNQLLTNGLNKVQKFGSRQAEMNKLKELYDFL